MLIVHMNNSGLTDVTDVTKKLTRLRFRDIIVTSIIGAFYIRNYK